METREPPIGTPAKPVNAVPMNRAPLPVRDTSDEIWI